MLFAGLHLLAGGEMMERKRDSSPQEEVIEASGFDIFLGRHKYCFHHTGNRCFRTLIANNLEWYASLSTKREKSAVSGCLLKLIRSGGGRFLKEGPSLDQWYEVDDKIAREKISHALRDQGNQRTFRNPSKSSRNKKDYTNEHLDTQDSMMPHPKAFIDYTNGSQEYHFVAPVQPADYWRYLVLETLQESMNVFKAGEAKNAASYNLESGTRHDLDMTQPDSNDKPKEAWLDTTPSNAWPAQPVGTVEPMGWETTASSGGKTANNSDARARESGLDRSFVPQNEYAALHHYYLVRQTIQKSLRVSNAAEEAKDSNAFNLKRGARQGLVQPGSNIALNKWPESNIFGEKCHDFIRSNTGPAQRTSTVKPIDGETSASDSTHATKRHAGVREMERCRPDWNAVLQNEHPSLDHALLASSRRYSVLKPYRTSLSVSEAAKTEKGNTSDRNRVTGLDHLSRLGFYYV
jgi:hypothetical protein